MNKRKAFSVLLSIALLISTLGSFPSALAASGTAYCYMFSYTAKPSTNPHDYGYLNPNVFFDTTDVKGSFIGHMGNTQSIYGPGCGYSPTTVITNGSASSVYSSIQSGKVFFYHGHGAPGMLTLYDANGYYNGNLVSHSYQATDPKDYNLGGLGATALSSEKCVLYIGCNTGVSVTNTMGTFNLVSITVSKGAGFALGTKRTTYVGENSMFLDKFWIAANKGKTIDECIEFACVKPGQYGLKREDLYYVGNLSQKLN